MLDASRRSLIWQDHFNRDNPEIAGRIESAHNTQASAPTKPRLGNVCEISSTTNHLCGARFCLDHAIGNSALHHAHKHHHSQVISQCRPWDANAAVSQPADSWWTHLINGAESAPAGH